MAVVHTLESATGQELWKWDHTIGESIEVNGNRITGVRPISHQDYPAAMYKAVQSALGKITYEMDRAETEVERSRLESQGYVLGRAGRSAQSVPRAGTRDRRPRRQPRLHRSQAEPRRPSGGA